MYKCKNSYSTFKFGVKLEYNCDVKDHIHQIRQVQPHNEPMPRCSELHSYSAFAHTVDVDKGK